jgi:hypothetical protein
MALTTSERGSSPYADLHVKPYAERHVKVYADTGHAAAPGCRQAPPQLRAVTALAGGHHDRQRPLALLDRQVQLAGQPATGPPERVIGGLDGDSTRRLALEVPLLRAPAACWCALATVASTLTSQVIKPSASARACSRVRIRCQVPSRCQRRNSPYTVCHGP